MLNKEALETNAVLSQLKKEHHLPMKFLYCLNRLLKQFQDPVKAVDEKVKETIEGQAEYFEARNDALKAAAIKDKQGNPVILSQTQNSIRYDIPEVSQEKLKKKLETVDEKHKDVKEAIEARDKDLEEFLDAEYKDFKPYMVDIKYLPLKKAKDAVGKPMWTCLLNAEQLESMFDYLEGDIDKLPDPAAD